MGRMTMNETNPPQSNSNKNKKGKRRKRSSKKFSSECAGKSKSLPSPNDASKSDVHHPVGKSPIKSTNTVQKSHKNHVKVTRSDKYPYPTDYNDHFETPARAYDDIFPLLSACIVMAQKKSRKNQRNESDRPPANGAQQRGSDATIIYDPYFCTGRAAILLEGVFQRHKSKHAPSAIRIQHEKRDFYRDIRQNSVPDYDMLVTNPPYSGNHKEQCLEFAVNQLNTFGRPFFLLMPNYIATKEYFRKIVLHGEDTKKIQTFYIAPSSSHPYEYDHPEDTGHAVSPFASVWFCGLCHGEGDLEAAVTDAFIKFHASSSTGTPQIATSLRELIRIGGVSGDKRKNPRQRKKMRRQAMQNSNIATVTAGTHTIGDTGGKSQNTKRKLGSHGGQHKREESKSNQKKRKVRR